MRNTKAARLPFLTASDDTIMGKLFQPLGPLQALHAADDDAIPAAEATLLCLFDGAAKAGGAVDLVGGLIEQLAAVG